MRQGEDKGGQSMFPLARRCQPLGSGSAERSSRRTGVQAGLKYKGGRRHGLCVLGGGARGGLGGDLNVSARRDGGGSGACSALGPRCRRMFERPSLWC